MSGMAEVLAAHTDWTYLIASNTMACTGRHCVWIHALQAGETGRDVYRTHQADALTAAGFGPVKEAAAKALEDAAQEFTERVAVTRKMTPDDGTPYNTATRNHAYGMQIATLALRARAAAVRGEG